MAVVSTLPVPRALIEYGSDYFMSQRYYQERTRSPESAGSYTTIIKFSGKTAKINWRRVIV